jgi:hypothetical protein
MPKDQLVTCADHGRRRGYAICDHVLAGAKAVHIESATPEAIGILSCDLCATPPVSYKNFKLVCEHCARVRGHLVN